MLCDVAGSTRKDFGVCEDVGDFYKRFSSSANNGSLATRVAFWFLSGSIDSKVQELRSSYAEGTST